VSSAAERKAASSVTAIVTYKDTPHVFLAVVSLWPVAADNSSPSCERLLHQIISGVEEPLVKIAATILLILSGLALASGAMPEGISVVGSDRIPVRRRHPGNELFPDLRDLRAFTKCRTRARFSLLTKALPCSVSRGLAGLWQGQ